MSINHNGGNPFGNFKSPSFQNVKSLKNNSIYNFNDAFSKTETILEKPDFRNTGNLLHNNVANDVQGEFINEYQINIDSRDRDINSYPNPFSFTVTFGGSTRQTLTNNDGYCPITYEGSAGPIILKDFKNVKFVYFNYILLPNMKKDEKDDTMDFSQFPYIIIRIQELTTTKTLSTSSAIGGNGYVFYPEQYVGGNYSMWLTYRGSKIFLNSELGNITKLSFSIHDPDGNVFYTCPKENFQCFISMTFGVFENEINTKIKYYK